MRRQNKFPGHPGIEILAAGRKTQTPSNRLKRWRTLNAFALVYICEGGGSFESNETALFDVSAGNCFFLFPGVSHFYGPPGQKLWKEIWVLYRGYIADHMLKDETIDPSSPVLRIAATRRSEFQSNLNNLVDRYRIGSQDYRLHCSSLLYSCLLMAALPPDSPVHPPEKSQILEEMKEVLRRNMSSSRSIPSFFRSSRYSYNTLRMEFRKLTGQSPGEYLNELRMRQAEEQLLWSSRGIGEIGRSLGFADSRYFSKVFKQHAGISPGAFRHKYDLIRRSPS